MNVRWICMSILLLASVAMSQDVSFVASVEPSTVAANDQFQVSFTLTGGDVNGARGFKAPDFSPLVVLSGPNQASSFQFINGQVSGSLTYSYYLYARQPGRYTIGSATIEYKSTTLKTEPIQIEVTHSRQPRQQSGTQQQESQEIGDNLFIRAIADKQRVKQGEQVTITYKLYTRVQVSGYDLSKAPAYQGFWAEEIEQPRQPTVTTETYEGKQYRVATIRKTALFPTQTGRLTVAPLEVRCAVQIQRRRTNDPFDAFFNDPFFSRLQTVEHTFTSNALAITVEPLPGNAPTDFTGAVGRYSMNVTVDKKEVKTGDPITLRMAVSGAGNVKLLSLPKPNIPADFESYEPKISDEVTREGGIIRGRKVAEYLLIPRNAGTRTIEPVTFSYFDLERNSYVTLRSTRFDFTITPGKEVASGVTVAAKSDIRLLGEDIRFLKLTSSKFIRLDESPFAGGGFVAAMILPPLVFLGALMYRKRMERLTGNIHRLRFEKAGKEATKRLKLARKLLAQGNTQSYHAEVARALTMYLEDKLRIPKASFSIDEAVQRLQARGVDSETIGQLRSCLERAEFVRFAPSTDTQVGRQELLDAATEAINRIEKSYNGTA